MLTNWSYVFLALTHWYLDLYLPSGSILTLSMRDPSYLGQIKLISWLLMCWLLASPGHQQPSWWRHQMETFSVLLTICAGNGECPAQKRVTQSFSVFFDLHLNQYLSKQWRGWWFEMLPRSLWCHCNDAIDYVCWVGPCLVWGRISTTCVISMRRNYIKC